MKNILRISLIGMAALVASCSNDSNKWHLNGSINGLSDSDQVLLEANNQGYWYVLDTLKIKNGKINYAGDIHGYPDIFRLRLGNSSLYFPIDSIETVTITATAPDIAANHTLTGSPQAINLARVDSMLTVVALDKGVQALPSDESLKRELANAILADPAGIVSYYIISKTIGNTPLYNPSMAMDNRIIGAVANAFSSQRPDDPRTKYLTSLFLRNRRPNPAANNRVGQTLQANVINSFEINLYDNKGRQHSLLELTESGRPVILSFTAYTAEWSPAYNLELNKVYDKYHNQGLEIYQVSFDDDEYVWKQSADNLPWVTVYNNLSDGDKVLRQYNVTQLPTTFVFNRNGELMERVTDISKLESAVNKVI